MLDGMKHTWVQQPSLHSINNRQFLGGNMVDWSWFGWFDKLRRLEEVVISWDTAMKATELSDYSVGTVWGWHADFTICSI